MEPTKHSTSTVGNHIRGYWFSYGILICALIGLVFPGVSEVIKVLNISKPLIFAVFLTLGVEISRKRFNGVFLNGWAWIPSVATILFVSPFIFYGISWVLLRSEPDLFVGMLLTGVLPTTITSAVVLTDKARGDVPTSLAITIISNLIGVFTVGPLFSFFIHTVLHIEVARVSVSAYKMILDLVITVLIPFVIGQLIQPFVRRWIPLIKPYASVFRQAVILILILSAIGRAQSNLKSHIHVMHLLVLTCVANHLVLLGIARLQSGLARSSAPVTWAVLFTVSQKTLAIGYLIWESYLSESFPLAGLPIVIYHPMQLIIDGFLAQQSKLR